mgnify:CR=1 FL=1
MKRNAAYPEPGRSLNLYHKPARAFSRYVNGTPVYHCRELHTFRDNDVRNQDEKEYRSKLIQVYRTRARLELDLFDEQNH